MRLPRARFTVRRVMALVALLAVGLGVMRHAVASWGPGEVMTIAPTVLLATPILAWSRRARRRAFWVGFGLSGWAYLLFTLDSPLAEHLPTAWLLDRLYANRPLPEYFDCFGPGIISAQAHGESFRRAGQSVISLLFALLGGSAAITLMPARAEDEAPFPPDGSLLKPGWRAEMSGRP